MCAEELRVPVSKRKKRSWNEEDYGSSNFSVTSFLIAILQIIPRVIILSFFFGGALVSHQRLPPFTD